jgi:hypothetical protein
VTYYQEPWLHAGVPAWTEEILSGHERYIAKNSPPDAVQRTPDLPAASGHSTGQLGRNEGSSVRARGPDVELAAELEARLQAQQEETAVLRQLAELLEQFRVQLPEDYQGTMSLIYLQLQKLKSDRNAVKLSSVQWCSGIFHRVSLHGSVLRDSEYAELQQCKPQMLHSNRSYILW